MEKLATLIPPLPPGTRAQGGRSKAALLAQALGDWFQCSCIRPDPGVTFSQPDTGTFTCLASCIEAAKRGGLYPCVVNGANEEAVSLFLQDKIGYLDLFDAVEAALDHFDLGDYTSVEEVLEADRKARAFVRERYGK